MTIDIKPEGISGVSTLVDMENNIKEYVMSENETFKDLAENFVIFSPALFFDDVSKNMSCNLIFDNIISLCELTEQDFPKYINLKRKLIHGLKSKEVEDSFAHKVYIIEKRFWKKFLKLFNESVIFNHDYNQIVGCFTGEVPLANIFNCCNDCVVNIDGSVTFENNFSYFGSDSSLGFRYIASTTKDGDKILLALDVAPRKETIDLKDSLIKQLGENNAN